MKGYSTEWEKVFISHTWGRGTRNSRNKIQRATIQIADTTQQEENKNPRKEWAEKLKRHCSKKEI